MMQTVRGIYRGGMVELLEEPVGVATAEVMVTSFAEDAEPLDDFEPIVPAKPVRLSRRAERAAHLACRRPTTSAC